MRTPPTTFRALLPALVLALPLAACSTESEMRADDPSDPGVAGAPSGDGSGMPTAVPAADGPVRTAGLVTVLDSGTGPQLCSAVAESYPPQCSGLPIEGWSWKDNPMHESASGTRWGSFALVGTFDGEAFTVTDATPAALYDPMAEPDEPSLTTPCEEPDGGWKVLDPSKTTPETMDATFVAASALPDYASAWMDQSINPASTSDDPAVQESEMNDPELTIINVVVTGDPAAAEAELRRTWGGMLCVSTAEVTEREMLAIQEDLSDLPGLQSSGSVETDVLDATVLFDDGSIQEWADATYGEGRVRISSLLVPAE
jgi:hypothetical protein